MTINNLIIEKLLDASHKPSHDCSQAITDILFEGLPIKACSFYSFFKKTNLLTLRAQTGFDYHDYKSFELDLDRLAGTAIVEEKLIFCDNLKNEPKYRDRNLIEKYSLKKFIAFPMEAKNCLESYDNSICQKYSGVVCLYPHENVNEILSRKSIEELSSLVGRVYSYSVVADRLLVRTDIVATSITSTDLNSFLYKVIKLLSEKWCFEASSIFFYDDRNETMFMRATTGVKSELMRFENIYRKGLNGDDEHLTMKCYLNKEIITVVTPDKFNPHGKYPEIVEKDKKSEIYIPIAEPTHNGRDNEITGVLRTVNRIVKRDNVIETCCHGWEDISLLLFVSEVIGIISHLFKRTDAITLNFERAMHGINKPIIAAKIRLNTLDECMSRLNINLPRHYEYFLKDSIAYIDALEWQIRKHTSRDSFKKIKISKINIYGAVLSKIAAFIEEVYKTYNVQNVRVSRLVDFGFDKFPPVLGNEKALQIVFRNIVENAMKYHNKREICDIAFSWSEDSSSAYIYIADKGFGINEKDAEKIFQEGYRSTNAMRREPTGTGIGLSDSKGIMLSMNGDLYLHSRENPTIFVVKLNKY